MSKKLHNAVGMVNRFNIKHGVTIKNQGLQLGSEYSELRVALDKGDFEPIREEVGDVMFVSVSVGLLAGQTDFGVIESDNFDVFADNSVELCSHIGSVQDEILKDNHNAVKDHVNLALGICSGICTYYHTDAVEALHDVADENLDKDASTEGGKVTKEGLE